MLDKELEQLLAQWSNQIQLRDAEVTEMLSGALPCASLWVDPAAPWIIFWQQIGQLIHVQQNLGGLALLGR